MDFSEQCWLLMLNPLLYALLFHNEEYEAGMFLNQVQKIILEFHSLCYVRKEKPRALDPGPPLQRSRTALSRHILQYSKSSSYLEVAEICSQIRSNFQIHFGDLQHH